MAVSALPDRRLERSQNADCDRYQSPMSTAKPAKSRWTVRTRPRSSVETAMARASAPHTSVVRVRRSNPSGTRSAYSSARPLSAAEGGAQLDGAASGPELGPAGAVQRSLRHSSDLAVVSSAGTASVAAVVAAVVALATAPEAPLAAAPAWGCQGRARGRRRSRFACARDRARGRSRCRAAARRRRGDDDRLRPAFRSLPTCPVCSSWSADWDSACARQPVVMARKPSAAARPGGEPPAEPSPEQEPPSAILAPMSALLRAGPRGRTASRAATAGGASSPGAPRPG